MRHINDDNKWDSNQLISDDEADFLGRLIKQYKFKNVGKSEELLNLVPSMTKRAYNSIELIY